MDQPSRIETVKALQAKIATIDNLQDFNKFLEALEDAWRRDAFEPQDVTEYLSGIWGVIDAMADADAGGRLDQPVEPSWRFFANVLLRAFFHS